MAPTSNEKTRTRTFDAMPCHEDIVSLKTLCTAAPRRRHEEIDEPPWGLPPKPVHALVGSYMNVSWALSRMKSNAGLGERSGVCNAFVRAPLDGKTHRLVVMFARGVTWSCFEASWKAMPVTRRDARWVVVVKLPEKGLNTDLKTLTMGTSYRLAMPAACAAVYKSRCMTLNSLVWRSNSARFASSNDGGQGTQCCARMQRSWYHLATTCRQPADATHEITEEERAHVAVGVEHCNHCT